MVAATSKVLLFISCSSCLFAYAAFGYAIDRSGGDGEGGDGDYSDSNPSNRNAAARDYVVAHEHPTKADLFDLDWEQVDERYDPRLLSEDLINESQSEWAHKDDSHRRQAEHCYFEGRKYEHGQKILRPTPYEACICVDGETFCWWKQFDPVPKKVTTGKKKAKLFTKSFSATTTTTAATTAADAGGKPVGAPRLVHPSRYSTGTSYSVASGSAERKRNRKLPLSILNFPQNLPVHLSEIDLMIESDGVARSTPKLGETLADTTTTPTPGMITDTGRPSAANSTGPAGDGAAAFMYRETNRDTTTTDRPLTPVSVVTATASTTNYSDEQSNGQATNTTTGNANVALWTTLQARQSSGGSQTAVINRNLPQPLSESESEIRQGSDSAAGHNGSGERRLKDQPSGGNFPVDDTVGIKSEQPASGHQMTKNINDVRNNESIIKSQVQNGRGGGGGREWNETTDINPSSTIAPFVTPLAVSRLSSGVKVGAAATAEAMEQEEDADVDRTVPAADEDFIRKISIDDDSPLAKHYIITSSGSIENIPLASQFRENFINEIMPLNSVEKAVKLDSPPPPPTLILDTYPSSMVTRPGDSGIVDFTRPVFRGGEGRFQSTIASGAPTLPSSASYATKLFIPSNTDESFSNNPAQELVQVWSSSQQQQLQQRKKDFVAKAMVEAENGGNSNNKIQDPVCIVMGQTYKVGMVLPQEAGNCLQCVCIEGPSAGEAARVTCSPHNCPPLILPDLFDTTGY